MTRLILRRLAQAVPLLLVVSAIVFALLHAVPGGPLAAYLENPNVRPEDIARLRAAYGLDRPLLVQYGAWLLAFVRGDWGMSFADGRPVLSRMLERLPATLELAAVSGVAALALAVGVAIGSVVNRSFDRAASAVAVAGISLPVFWFGLLLQLLLAHRLGWLPSSGRADFGASGLADRVAHLVLPVLALAFVQAAAWSRYLRRALREVLARPFIRAARTRGIAERDILLRHALPNALGPFVTVVLLDAAMLVSGAVVTESVFAWPGIGSLFTEALGKRDYPVLMAFLMVGAAAVVLLNLIADLIVAAIDPRLREPA
ncbi:MAG: ABC transporter permease [Gemmatimonadetes bacterium]|nr:ABC transporter permease [Gemmatimonadota bacterium]